MGKLAILVRAAQVESANLFERAFRGFAFGSWLVCILIAPHFHLLRLGRRGSVEVVMVSTSSLELVLVPIGLVFRAVEK